MTPDENGKENKVKLIAMLSFFCLIMIFLVIFSVMSKGGGASSNASSVLEESVLNATRSEVLQSEVSSYEPSHESSSADSQVSSLPNSTVPSKVSAQTSQKIVSSTVNAEPKPQIRQEDLTDYSDLKIDALYALDKLDNKKNGWGFKRPAQGVRPSMGDVIDSLFKKYDAFYLAPDNKNVYLTFDCGYENGYTEKILDTLWNNKVKAVFFVTLPFAKENPKIVNRMLNEGHVVGNHTNNHPSMPSKDITVLFNEIAETDKYILDNFKYKMTYFRPPSGEYSERTLAVTQALGYKSVFWSFAYLDYDVKKQPSKSEAYKMITTHSHPGAIFLLHAVSKANTEALGDVIATLKTQGYTIKLLDV